MCSPKNMFIIILFQFLLLCSNHQANAHNTQQSSFNKDVINKAGSTDLLSPDGHPTLYSYLHETVRQLTLERIIDRYDDDSKMKKDEMEERVKDVLALSKKMSSSAGRTAVDKNHQLLQEGTRITAMWKGGTTWYNGHIDYVNQDGTVDIQYDDGDYEWYVQTEAYVKASPSKKSGRSKTPIHADINILKTGSETQLLYETVQKSVTSHLRQVPSDGAITYTREHEVKEAHFGGSDVDGHELTEAERSVLNLVEEMDLNIRSHIEANMKNNHLTITMSELKKVLNEATNAYEKGLQSKDHYVRRRSHVSYSQMHDFLWASNSEVFLKQWYAHVENMLGLNACFSSKDGVDVTAVKDVLDESEINQCHRQLRIQHLKRAADLGSPEAQSQLGIELIQPSPDPELPYYQQSRLIKKKTASSRPMEMEPFGKLFTVPISTKPTPENPTPVPNHSSKTAWSRRADALLHLTFSSSSNNPKALMTLGHQHYFHHYEKSDQSSYPSSMSGEEENDLLNRAMDEGGSFLPKSCHSSVHYYDRVSNIIEEEIEKNGIHIPKEMPLLHVEESDGIQGRRHAQYHGSSPTTIGGPIRNEDGRRTVLKRANGASDEVVKYYKYQAQSHLGNEKMMAKHDQDLAEVYYFGIRNIERNANVAAKHFRIAAEAGNPRAMGMLGHLYSRGHGVPTDASKAYNLYKSGTSTKSSDRKGGNRMAHAGLGIYNLFGIPPAVSSLSNYDGDDDDDDIKYTNINGVEKKLKKVNYYLAREHLQKAANAGEISAYYLLGKMRMLGLFVRPDAKKAYSLFAKSAQGGNPLAKKMMAKMSLAGIGTSTSCVTAVKHLKEIAENSGPWVIDMERAHAHYKSGNIKMSLSLYTRMATLGYSRAQANAAFILEKHLQQDHQNRGSFLNGVVNSVSRKIFSFFDTGNDDDAKRKEGKREQIHEKEKEVDIYNPPSLSDIRGERALYLYSQAASQGHDFARLKMGDLVFYGFAGLARGDSSSSSSRSSSSRSNSRDNNNNKNYLPDYKRAKALYQRATAATQSAHVQSQARFALGWMHEVGYPSNGVPRDIHLAKRMYDDASTLSNDANVPVKLALMRMRASDAMQTMLESWFVKKLVVGSINSIRRSFGRKDIWSNILDERTEEEIKKDKEEKMKVKKEKEKKVNEEIEKIKLRKSYDMRGNTVVAGSMVKARWRKGRTYYTGYLSKINIDGTMNIQYDDGDVELSVQTRFVQRVTDKLHPLYVKKEKKEKMLKNMKEKIAAASSGTNSGSNIEDGNMGSQDHGKGWFTSSFVVRLLVHDINWDMVALLFVLFLSIAFLLWSVGEIFKSQYWKVMAVIIGCVIHFLLIREYE